MIRRLNSRVNNHSLSYLSEVNRKDLVLKSIRQSPERMERSKDYRITGNIEVNVDDFLNKDQLTVMIPVNEYECTIEFNNVIETVAKVVDKQHRGNVNFDSIEKALNIALDEEKDLLVNCTCPDFYYRFSYVATRNGYKKGKRQLIPAPIRNPHDNKGSMCKHLLMILKNKDWVRKLASVVNYLIKEYYYEILQIYDLNAEHFFINLNGQHSPKYKGTRPQPGRSKLNRTYNDVDDIDDDEDEEEFKLKI